MRPGQRDGQPDRRQRCRVGVAKRPAKVGKEQRHAGLPAAKRPPTGVFSRGRVARLEVSGDPSHQFQGMPYEQYLKAFEAVCTDLGGRPHWGKMHYRTADSLRPAYPHFDDFLAVRNVHDSGRVFANAYTTQGFRA